MSSVYSTGDHTGAPGSQAAQARYRARLVALATDSALGRALAEAAQQRAWWPAPASWSRRYTQFNPYEQPFARLVCAAQGRPQALCHVDVFEVAPQVHSADDYLVFDATVGWLRLRRFPMDDTLTTIKAVLALPGQPTVVQYWPERRCTMRFDAAGQTRFAKIYPKKFLRRGRGAAIHDVGVALWEAAARGDVDFAVPCPERWDASTQTLWQAQLPGTPAVHRLLGSEGCRMAQHMGQAAASITRCALAPCRVFDRTEQLKDSLEYGHDLVRRVPYLAVAVEALLLRLQRAHTALAVQPLRPVHGDMHADQWLEDEGRLGLVDFDDVSLGDPERDAAFFMVQLAAEYGLHAALAPVAAAFLAGYESVAGSLDRALLRTYMAHKWLSKALKAARTLQPDGDTQAVRHLRRAQHSLQSAMFSEM